MGTISERKQKDGTIRYRAEIRINKDGINLANLRHLQQNTCQKLAQKTRNRD